MSGGSSRRGCRRRAARCDGFSIFCSGLGATLSGKVLAKTTLDLAIIAPLLGVAEVTG